MNRYDLLREKITEWFNNKTQDINILYSLYSQSNLEESDLVDRTVDLKNETMFSNLSDEELLCKFEKEFFNKYSTNELTHLFQETHNRYIRENNLEVTRNVAVLINAKEPGMGGYVCSGNDLLFINKFLINYAKGIEATAKGDGTDNIINKESIGKVYLDVLLHESKHVLQYEDAIDFALNAKQNKTRAFSGAAMFINNVNFYIANSRYDEDYFQDWHDKYAFHFHEHEANYSAIQRIEKIYPNKLKKNLGYAQFQTLYMDASLHFRPTIGDEEGNAKLCADRVKALEEYLEYQIEYFKQTADCSLRRKALKVMEEYLKVDENGESLLHKRLTKEVNELCKLSLKAQKTIKTYEQLHSKKKGKPVNLLPSYDDTKIMTDNLVLS